MDIFKQNNLQNGYFVCQNKLSMLFTLLIYTCEFIFCFWEDICPTVIGGLQTTTSQQPSGVRRVSATGSSQVLPP